MNSSIRSPKSWSMMHLRRLPGVKPSNLLCDDIEYNNKLYIMVDLNDLMIEVDALKKLVREKN